MYLEPPSDVALSSKASFKCRVLPNCVKIMEPYPQQCPRAFLWRLGPGRWDFPLENKYMGTRELICVMGVSLLRAALFLKLCPSSHPQ